MSGHLAVVGLGPGDARYLTPEADDALAAAQAFMATGPISTACRRARTRAATPPTIARSAPAPPPRSVTQR